MKELRIGLVLYGGVSLAVYMNGVVTEIWHALRASAARASRKTRADGTAAVYRKLLDDLKQLDDSYDLRIVVDTITGTSAGGVNGVALGKAIATGANARVLNETWIEKAGIGKLKAQPRKRTPWLLRLVDNVAAVRWSSFRKLRRFLDGTPGINWVWARDHIYSFFTSNNPKKTPLNGNYFTEMIAGTLEDLSSPPAGSKLIPPGGRLDLVLTSTDLHGWPRHLPVEPRFHEELLETAHAHRMHFRFHRPLGQQGDGGDFKKECDFGLTYAARATAGFPIAFAPVSYRTVAKSFKKARFEDPFPDKDVFAARHLPEHHLAGYKASKVWMVDGGILDNKPFSAAIRLIEEKPANRAVYRTLIYIEPDPALVESVRLAPMPLLRWMPSLLYKLFRHEPIFADLHAVASRNRFVKRLIAIADAAQDHGERVLDNDLSGRAVNLEQLRAAANDHLRTGNNPSYPGYVVLKARRAADTLASSLCEAFGYPHESKHGYVVRQVFREFLRRQGAFDPPRFDGRTYNSNTSQIALLRTFDVPYRLRRMRYLVRIANEQYSRSGIEAASVDAFKHALMRSAFALDELTAWVREQSEALRTSLRHALGDDVDAYLRNYDGQLSKLASLRSRRIDVMYRRICIHFSRTMDDQGKQLRKAINGLPPKLGRLIARAYVTYPMVDVAIFPMMDSAGVRDLSTTRVLRISPHDATALSNNPRRLKSRELGAFAGFLRRASREHDLLWGRLDGAERLIDLVVAAARGDAKTDSPKIAKLRDEAIAKLRDEALNDAIQAILDESERAASKKLRREICYLRTKLRRFFRRSSVNQRDNRVEF